MSKKLAVILLATFCLTFLGLFAFDLLASDDREESTPDPTPTTVQPTTFVSDPNHEIMHTAWIPDWGSKDGLFSLKENVELFESISPVWYEVNTDGTLINKRPSAAGDISAVAKNNGILMIPAIAMFDHEIFTPVLQEEGNLDRHVESIMAEVEKHDYDGIDLDYESTKLSDKEKYFEFIEKLSTALHAQDKLLVVTVLAKWGDGVNYPSLRETRQVQDWSELAKHADEIRIMAYDYTFSKSQNPGPIAPIDWIELILNYAVLEIPREKIVLGVHLYSYEWWNEAEIGASYDSIEYPTFTFLPEPPKLEIDNPKTARSYTYSTVQSILRDYDGELMEFQDEQVFSYQKINGSTGRAEKRVLVFIDPAGVKARTELAREYNIKGVAYWRLGGEGELLD